MKMSILEYQEATKQCQQVWCVHVACDGETDLAAVYETRDGAERHRDWQNARPRYYGKAVISSMPVITDQLSADRWGNSVGDKQSGD